MWGYGTAKIFFVKFFGCHNAALKKILFGHVRYGKYNKALQRYIKMGAKKKHNTIKDLFFSMRFFVAILSLNIIYG